MKPQKALWLLFGIALLWPLQKVWAYDSTPLPTPTALTASDLELAKKQLEIEQLQLENDKLKLEIEKLKFQLSQTPVPGKPSEIQNDGSKKEEKEDIYLADESKKAQDLAQQNKDADDLLVVDFVNAEGWYKGVRYGLHDLFTLAEDLKWPMSKKLESRKSSGSSRNLYRIKNLSLLRYEDESRGIVELKPPLKEGDLRILTPEGVSFDSGVGDVRNAFQSIYFTYDGQDDRNGLKVLRYGHGRGLSFSDQLEVLMDKEGKIKAFRYGVLDEK